MSIVSGLTPGLKDYVMTDHVLERPLSFLHRDVIAPKARAALDRTTLNFLRTRGASEQQQPCGPGVAPPGLDSTGRGVPGRSGSRPDRAALKAL